MLIVGHMTLSISKASLDLSVESNDDAAPWLLMEMKVKSDEE